MIYHVSIYGNDQNTGSAEAPFRTINHAAQVAVAGDTVQVHEGTYREWVDPKFGGTDENCRIVYEAAPGEHPVIKGSEIVTDWERVEGTVWKKVLPNAMFGDWNPYSQKVEGDWFAGPQKYSVHLGDVYINGVSMYEASNMDDLWHAEIRYHGYQRTPLPEIEPIRNPEKTVYRWLATVDDESTTVFCNFQDLDPNRETIEINVRKCCFYPRQSGRDFITVRGFEIAHAACPFTPPTSNQVGMVGANWSRGWIIENNDLHDAKCSAVSIGTNAATGDNDCMRFHRRHSHYYQTEAVFLGLLNGWSQEKIGSHLIRNNEIHDCGQNAIVGHMGGAFSRIEHNHIYNISVKHEFHGAEIAGIKLHAAIDVVIENNVIHDCTRCIWLDWQAQGTRVTRNLFYNNDRCDLMIEVTHGPCLVDHNIFLSKNALENVAQGTAFVHNLFAGNAVLSSVMDRDTPYHFPHTTNLKGVTKVLGGDDRVFNNIMLGAYSPVNTSFLPLSACYNSYATAEVYYAKMVEKIDRHPKQPVWIEGNAYAGYAGPFRAEKSFVRADGIKVSIEENNGTWLLNMDVPESVVSAYCEPVTTERLGTPVFTEEPYENPDGTPIDFTLDMLGNRRTGDIIPGPFAGLATGKQELVVWKK